MKKNYYLSNNGTHVGPYSSEDVLAKVNAKEHQWTDYIFDEAMGEWIMLLEHPEFAEKLSQKPPSRVEPETQALATFKNVKEKEWFILREGNNYGPYCKLELVQMLQEKTLFEYDYIWHAHLPSWKRVSELKDFSPDEIRLMKESMDVDVSEVFFRRRHARATYGASLIVHNNKTVFRGKSLEISAGGAGVMIDNPNLQPGQSLFLHFQPGDGVPPFNAVCQVVSKQYTKEMNGENSVKYGVKFTTLSQSVRETIKNFTANKDTDTKAA